MRNKEKKFSRENNVENFFKIVKTSYNLLLEKNGKLSIIEKTKEEKGEEKMKVEYKQKDKLLLLEITEEIDHHAVEIIRRKADYEITRYMPRKVVFDFRHVTFMDSAGIGMVLGRYKMMKMLGGTVEMTNVSPMLKKIFEMSGITRICPISSTLEDVY